MDKENVIRTMFSLIGMAVGIMLTYFTAITSHSTELVRLSEQIIALRSLLSDHATAQYTLSAARADFRRVQQQIDSHSTAIDKLEKNQERHEELYHNLRKKEPD